VAGLAFSGVMLGRFCPDAAACVGDTVPLALWGVAASVAVITPVTLTILRMTKCIS